MASPGWETIAAYNTAQDSLHAAADAIFSDAFAASRSLRDSNADQKTFIASGHPTSRLGKLVAAR